MDEASAAIMECASALPMREWIAIERAALLADAGHEGEAELARFAAGYHESAVRRHDLGRVSRG